MRLKAKYSTTRHRADNDTSVEFLGNTFNLPVIPANMKTIIDIPLAINLAIRDYFYILHRFMDYDDIVHFVHQINEKGLISSISIGVQAKDRELIRRFKSYPDYVTIDVAHGHNILVKEMIEDVRKVLPQSKLIVGNAGTHEAIQDIRSWGADCVKIGLGNGSACLTFNETGFQTTIYDLGRMGYHFPTIADGGVTDIKNIVDYLVLGHKMVMVGGLLAGFEESPSETINGKKRYAGSTADNKTHKEGTETYIEVRGSIWDQLDRIEQGLQSAISYAGGSDLTAFENVEWWD